MDGNTKQQIARSWNTRREFLEGVLNRGDVLVGALKMVPEARSEILKEWPVIVQQELDTAIDRNRNEELNLHEDDVKKIAMLTNPASSW